MSDPSEPSNLPNDMPVADRIDLLCDAFERDWLDGKAPRLEEFLTRIEIDGQAKLFRELLRLDFDYRSQKGSPIDRAEYVARFPSHVAAIADVFEGLTPMGETVVNSQDSEASRGDLPTLEIGARIGDYEILRELGRGGMGAVFQAEDQRLKRKVALKVMLPHVAQDETNRQRFLREAQAAAALEHDHIVTIYQVGEENGVPFIAMPFLKGESLHARLQRQPVLPVADAASIGRQIAEGLAAAHESGLIHRDIKPANIWLEEPRGRVKILDFGLARLATSSDVHLTTSGIIVGTPAYMAPEQARGASDLDFRCDLFSLGAILYRMVTGRQPFVGDSVYQLIHSLAIDTPPAPHELDSRIPHALSDLIMQLLARDPQGRPASALEVAQRLAESSRLAPRDESRTSPEVEFASNPQTITDATYALGNSHAEREGDTEANPSIADTTAIISSTNKRRHRFLAALAAIIVGLVTVTVVVFKWPDGTTAKIDGDSRGIDAVDLIRARDLEAAMREGSVPPAVDGEDPDYAKEREVAEWVVSIGGWVTVADAKGGLKSVSSPPLPESPFTVSSINLGNNPRVQDGDLARLSPLRNLRYLDLLLNPQITDAGVAHFEGQKRLAILTLNSAKISDRGMKSIAKLTALTTLYVRGTPITLDGLRPLAVLPITELFIDRTRIKHSDLPELVRLFPNLKKARVHDLIADSQFGLSPLSELQELETLIIRQIDLAPEEPHHLARFPKLRELQFYSEQIDESFFARLNRLPHLTTLGLGGSKLSTAAWRALAASPNIRILSFERGSSGDAEIESLAAMSGLQELKLIATKVTAPGAQRFHDLRPDVAVTGDFNLPATAQSKAQIADAQTAAGTNNSNAERKTTWPKGTGALQFDGMDDYVEIPMPGVEVGDAFTLEGFVEIRDAPPALFRPVLRWSGPRMFFLNVGRSGQRLGTSSWDENLYSHSETEDFRLKHPYHMAVVWRDARTRLFLDGVAMPSGPAIPSVNNGTHPAPPVLVLGAVTPLSVMKSNSDYRYFSGMMGELRISKVARYSKNFSPPTTRFEPDADTIALYHCDEGAGDVLKDSSGNNRHGKIFGAKRVQPSSQPE